MDKGQEIKGTDSIIPCPPTELGGCGTSTLELRRLLKCEKLLTNAEELTLQFNPPDVGGGF